MNRFILIAIWLATIIVAATQADARTWHVTQNGTGDAPTIQSAIDSASVGDVIELACGIYMARAITPISGITIRSATGDPDCVTIDGGNEPFYGSVFQCWGLDNTTVITGLTITGGLATDPYSGESGGGMVIAGSDLSVIRCRLTGNRAHYGGAIVLHTGAQPTFVECEITGNHGDINAGAVRVQNGILTANDCQIDGNTAGSTPREGTVWLGSEAHFVCCNLDPSAWAFTGTVTFANKGCDPVSIEPLMWGSLKALFRN